MHKVANSVSGMTDSPRYTNGGLTAMKTSDAHFEAVLKGFRLQSISAAVAKNASQSTHCTSITLDILAGKLPSSFHTAARISG